MLTSNAKGIFCDNVTCFGTTKSCSNRTHLQECFKCSSLLARVQLSIMFPNLSFPHTPCSFRDVNKVNKVNKVNVIMLWNDKNGDSAALQKIQLSSPFFYFLPGAHIRTETGIVVEYVC